MTTQIEGGPLELMTLLIMCSARSGELYTAIVLAAKLIADKEAYDEMVSRLKYARSEGALHEILKQYQHWTENVSVPTYERWWREEGFDHKKHRQRVRTEFIKHLRGEE